MNEITPEIAEAILSFLSRSQINGAEAPTLMNIVALLNRIAAQTFETPAPRLASLPEAPDGPDE